MAYVNESVQRHNIADYIDMSSDRNATVDGHWLYNP